MGVTYKLRQEVVDLIIQKKKENPSLSCRSLASILREVFQIDVSKSSINAVIKEFDLSSPVGRQRGNAGASSVKAQKNFFIPPEKKEQLFAQVAPFLPEEPQPVPVKEVIKEEPLPLSAPIRLVRSVDESPVIKKNISVWEQYAQAPVINNAGLFLVRALMSDVFRKPVIGAALVRAAGMDPDEAEHLEAAVFLSALGIGSVEGLHTIPVDVLAEMFAMGAEQVRDLLDRFLGKDLALGALAMALEIELAAGLEAVDFLVCADDSGRKFYLSGDLARFLPELKRPFSSPLFKAVEFVVDGFCSRKEPLMFQIPSAGSKECEFLMLLDGQSALRLDKIELWSEKQGKIIDYILNVGQKIDFIVRIEDPGVIDRIISDMIDNSQEFYDAQNSVEYRVTEHKFAFSSAPEIFFRAVLVETQNKQEKILFLTNMTAAILKSVDILKKYLEKRYLEGICNKKTGPEILIPGISIKKDTIYDLLSGVFDVFENMIVTNIFQSEIRSGFLKEIFKMPARVFNNEQGRYICFVADLSDPADVADLNHAVSLANAAAWRDPAGYRYFFSYKK